MKMRSKLQRNLFFESLELRRTMDASSNASAGLPWFDLGNLTYSFVPDGTTLGNHKSSLFAELATTGTKEQWQAEFVRALEDWLTPLGVQAREIHDNGDPFGVFGKTQGDTRFGDIRIGAIPLSNNVMAEAVQHAIITQGSWAGDILLNANADWSNLKQVYSMALHEIGHALGLGHSEDPASPMFFHGVYETNGPTASDIAELQKLYAGLEIAYDDFEKSEPAEYEWNEEPEFSFDATKAIPLVATVGSNVRYTATDVINDSQTSVLYRLEPLGEIDKVKFINLVVSADQFGGLFPKVELFDDSGVPIVGKILHYSTGVVVLQAEDVEPDKTYFVAVSPADTALVHQVGGFELLAEYSKTELDPTLVGELRLDDATPIFEQPFTVTTSRLVHVLLASKEVKHPSPVAAIWATLVDSDNKILAQLGMNQGQTRSMPVAFLEPGEYRVIVQAGTTDGSPIRSQRLSLFVDEISIDVGPGVINPAVAPVFPCGSLGANPNNCTNVTPVVIDVPTYPDPSTLPSNPQYPSIPPFSIPSWYFWPLASYRQNPLNHLDVSGNSTVTATDALQIINLLIVRQTKWDHFYDTNGDGKISASDALLVINYLNSRAQPEGESQSVSVGPADATPTLGIDFLADITEAKRRR